MIQHIGLVGETSNIPFSEVTQVAAALQKQVMRDFAPHWNVAATVDGFENIEDVPCDYWRAIVVEDIGAPAFGFHRTEDHKPFAIIQWRENWSISASHEVLEMLVDPGGDRQIAGQSPDPAQGRVLFLVEVCDPCTSDRYCYTVNNWPVSSFYTPRYFDPIAMPGVQYATTADMTQPRQVLPGGYLTWFEPEANQWWQQWHFNGQNRIFPIAPDIARFGSWRSAIDQLPPPRGGKQKTPKSVAQLFRKRQREGQAARRAMAERFRAELARRRSPTE